MCVCVRIAHRNILRPLFRFPPIPTCCTIPRVHVIAVNIFFFFASPRFCTAGRRCVRRTSPPYHLPFHNKFIPFHCVYNDNILYCNRYIARVPGIRKLGVLAYAVRTGARQPRLRLLRDLSATCSTPVLRFPNHTMRSRSRTSFVLREYRRAYSSSNRKTLCNTRRRK